MGIDQLVMSPISCQPQQLFTPMQSTDHPSNESRATIDIENVQACRDSSALLDVENVSYSFENGTVTILESESSGPESSYDEEIHSESQQCFQTDEDNYKHQM